MACTLIQRWIAGDGPHRIRDRAKAFGVTSFDSYADVQVCAYPEATALASLLTDPAVVTHLMNPCFTVFAQTRLLEQAVCTLMRGHLIDDPHELALRIITTGHIAVPSVYGLRRTPSAIGAPCELRNALQVSAKTHRACPLRHLEARKLPQIVHPRSNAARQQVGLRARR